MVLGIFPSARVALAATKSRNVKVLPRPGSSARMAHVAPTAFVHWLERAWRGEWPALLGEYEEALRRAPDPDRRAALLDPGGVDVGGKGLLVEAHPSGKLYEHDKQLDAGTMVPDCADEKGMDIIWKRTKYMYLILTLRLFMLECMLQKMLNLKINSQLLNFTIFYFL